MQEFIDHCITNNDNIEHVSMDFMMLEDLYKHGDYDVLKKHILQQIGKIARPMTV